MQRLYTLNLSSQQPELPYDLIVIRLFHQQDVNQLMHNIVSLSDTVVSFLCTGLQCLDAVVYDSSATVSASGKLDSHRIQ